MSGISIEAECLNALSPAGAQPTGFKVSLMLNGWDEHHGAGPF
jgi:hypothetical protein